MLLSPDLNADFSHGETFTQTAVSGPYPRELKNVPIRTAAELLLPRITYRLCKSDEDFAEVGRLRYAAYRNVGMVAANRDEVLLDARDREDNAYTYAVYLDGFIAGTLRFHLLSPTYASSPSMAMFPEVLWPRLEMGDTFIDPSRFAVDPEVAGRIQALPHMILRPVVAAAQHLGATGCLSLVQENHAAFYKRVFRSSCWAGPKRAPGLTVETYLYGSESRFARDVLFRRYPFFKTNRHEARRILGFDLPPDDR